MSSYFPPLACFSFLIKFTYKNRLSCLYEFHFEYQLHRCVIHDEMNKTITLTYILEMLYMGGNLCINLSFDIIEKIATIYIYKPLHI